MRVKDARQTFLGIWVKRVIEEQPLLVYGDGTQVRDFNFVDDVVNAMLLAAVKEEAYGQIFNLGADDPMSLKDVASLMTQVHPGNFEIVPFPTKLKAIDIGDYYGNYTKIKSLLGWAPRVRLMEGLTQTVEYYKQHLERYL